MLPAMQGESERSFAENSAKLIRALQSISSVRIVRGSRRSALARSMKLDDINPALTDFDTGDDGL
jgi:hypothetical protein